MPFYRFHSHSHAIAALPFALPFVCCQTDLSAAVDAAAHREARLNLSFERRHDCAQLSFEQRMEEANEIAAEHVDAVWAQHRELQVMRVCGVPWFGGFN